MTTFYVCTGKACKERFSQYILARLIADKNRLDPENYITIEETTCRGNCQEWPNILVDKELMTRMNPVKASEIFMKRLAIAKEKIKTTS